MTMAVWLLALIPIVAIGAAVAAAAGAPTPEGEAAPRPRLPPRPPGPAPQPRPGPATTRPVDVDIPVRPGVTAPFIELRVDDIKDSRPTPQPLTTEEAVLLELFPDFDPAGITVQQLRRGPQGVPFEVSGSLYLSAWEGGDAWQAPSRQVMYRWKDPAGAPLGVAVPIEAVSKFQIANTPESRLALPAWNREPRVVLIRDAQRVRVFLVYSPGDGSAYRVTGALRIYYL
jgi:hypothetical protein